MAQTPLARRGFEQGSDRLDRDSILSLVALVRVADVQQGGLELEHAGRVWPLTAYLSRPGVVRNGHFLSNSRIFLPRLMDWKLQKMHTLLSILAAF